VLLNGKSRGEGSPLVLIHGLFGDLDNLGGLAKSLAQHFCVYQIDLPNHGQSYHIKSMDYQSQSDAVIAWMNAQHLETVTLVGHSMGGKVAMAIAQRFPERVSQLVVMDIAPVDYQVSRHDNVFNALRETQTVTLENRQQAQSIMNRTPFKSAHGGRHRALATCRKASRGRKCHRTLFNAGRALTVKQPLWYIAPQKSVLNGGTHALRALSIARKNWSRSRLRRDFLFYRHGN